MPPAARNPLPATIPSLLLIRILPAVMVAPKIKAREGKVKNFIQKEVGNVEIVTSSLNN